MSPSTSPDDRRDRRESFAFVDSIEPWNGACANARAIGDRALGSFGNTASAFLVGGKDAETSEFEADGDGLSVAERLVIREHIPGHYG